MHERMSTRLLAFLSVHFACCFYLRIGNALAGALTVPPAFRLIDLLMSFVQRVQRERQRRSHFKGRNKLQESVKMLFGSLSCCSKSQTLRGKRKILGQGLEL